MSKLNERVLKPYLKIEKQPNTSIKYHRACDLIEEKEIFDFYDVEFECKLEKFDTQLPGRELFLMVSLVNETYDLLPNPNVLFCRNPSIRLLTHVLKPESDFYLFPISSENDLTCKIADLRIVEKSDHQLINLYEKLVLISLKEICPNEMENFEYFTQLDKLSQIKEKFEFYKKSLSSKSKKCRLKLQVLIYNKHEKIFENYLTEPVFTNVIHDRYPTNQNTKFESENLNSDTSITNLNNLRVLRSSRTCGTIKGGEEMFLLTTYFKPNDVEIEFFQISNTAEIGWRSFATKNTVEIHANCALVIQIPEFKGKIEKFDGKKDHIQKIKINYRLFRPSTRQYSENYTFYYVQDDAFDLKSIFTKDILEKKKNYLNLLEAKNNNLKRKQEEKVDSDVEMVVEEKKIKKVIHKETLENSEVKLDTRSSTPSPNLELIKTEPTKIIGPEEPKNVNSISPNSSFDNSVSIRLNTLVDREEAKSLNPLALKSNLDNCVSKMNALADRTGKSLLKFAKTRSFCELLKTQRFLINVQDDDGNTPIHLCILNGNFDLLEIFVDVTLTIPYQSIINIRNSKSLTPLLIACYMEEIEVCEFLLNANADLTINDYDGNNPIHVACKTKNLELLKILIKYAYKQCNFGILNSINHDGYSPLHICVLKESYEMVRELLYCKDLRINIPDKRCGYTALHHASSNFNLFKIAEILIRNEKIDLNCKSYTGCTPLHLAVANKNYFHAILLIKNGADSNIQNDLPVHFDYERFPIELFSHMKRIEDNLKKKKINHVLSRLAKNFSEEVTKLSEEVKRVFSTEIDALNDEESKIKANTHNYDAFTYAQNDPWMQEILKNYKDIPSDLLLKIFCFEKLRKEFYIGHVLKKDYAESFMKTAPGLIKSSQIVNLHGKEKISQQETYESKLIEKTSNAYSNDISRMEITN